MASANIEKMDNIRDKEASMDVLSMLFASEKATFVKKATSFGGKLVLIKVHQEKIENTNLPETCVLPIKFAKA